MFDLKIKKSRHTRLYQKINISFLTVFIIALGIILRIAQYIANRSLWVDEACIALNIVNRSFTELMQPLSLNQGAPIGFLFVEKTAVILLGNNEYALRLFPLVCGIASLFLLYGITRLFCNRSVTLFAVTIFAILEPLIYFSSELKQYSTDITASLLIMYLALRLTRNAPGFKQMIVFGIIGSVVLWFSHPVIFVLAGTWIALAIHSYRHTRYGDLRNLSVAAILWGLSFYILWSLNLRHLSENQYLLDYWQDAFMPNPVQIVELTKWIERHFFGMFTVTAGLWLPGLAAFTFITGCVSVWEKSKFRLVVLTSPIILALIASALHKYPFADRFLLFIVPSLVMLVAEGAGWISSKVHNHSTVAVYALIGLLLFQPMLNALIYLRWPRSREEIRPVMAYINNQQKPGDTLYIYYSAEGAFEYYAPKFKLKTQDVRGIQMQGNIISYQDDIDRLRGTKRVWILFSHVVVNGVNEEKIYTDYLDTIGKRLEECRKTGASAYLYDLSTHD